MSLDPGCAAPRQTLTVLEARRTILDAVAPVGGHECVALRASLGRPLARDVIAPCNVPAHDNSAMDGYAIRFDSLSAAGETRLNVVGTAFAGMESASGQLNAALTEIDRGGKALNATIDTLNASVDNQMMEYGASLIASNDLTQRNMLIVSLAGLIIGLLGFAGTVALSKFLMRGQVIE